MYYWSYYRDILPYCKIFENNKYTKSLLIVLLKKTLVIIIRTVYHKISYDRNGANHEKL